MPTSNCTAWIALVLLAACGGDDAPRRGLSVADALGGGSVQGYERAVAPRTFRFPDDHGPHPDFRSEWWYFTGNLETAAGRRFGFHVTFFRNAVRPDAVEPGGSAWRSRQLWMAHFALADVQVGRTHAAERFARGALGLAGARPEPFAVHVEDWSARSTGAGFAPLRLRASDGDVAIDLELVPEKAPVLQGDAGLSRKSARPGNASYYYSMTRLGAHGTVRGLDGAVHVVDGSAWIDREWSTSALGIDQVGWDWFALQLDDGRDLMFYRLRRADGSSDPSSAGVLVGGAGGVEKLALDDVGLEVTRTWTSPRTGAVYPAGLELRIPAHGLYLEVIPALDDQELELTFRYWEGAVDVRGRSNGAPIAGRGYLEMTGYADRREGD